MVGMKAWKQTLVMLLAVSLLAGCGLWTRDTAEPPAPLPDFEAEVEPQVLWSRNTGAGSDGQYLQLSPFLGPESVVVVDARGRVSAHALDDGDRLWRVNLNERMTAGVSGGGERIMVGTGKGHAIALSLETGEELWRRTLTSEVKGISRVEQGAVVFRTNDGRLHALDARTGETGWTAGRTTPALSLRGAGRPLMLSGRVAAGFDNGRVLMLGLGRGNVLWEATVSTPSGRSELERMADVDGELAVADGVLYAAGYQGQVMALSLSDGRVLWQRDLSSYRGVSVAGQMLFVTDSEGHVWALDRRNGATLWQQDQLRLRNVTLPVILDQYVVVGDYEGYLHWISPEDGALVGRARGDRQGIMGVPQVRDGVMYTLGRGGRLSAFTLPLEE
ncbi:outer membrane protein assembly factor BamB [Ectothiorhodospira haloalkaliphila]|nr:MULTISPECIES: outer membrane protein assembly factor BamB [Ectothiorhodospira]MCG5493009.1 outer membrane protein assembly factor BamB [Ectothiorhodospira variabilis]MCG5497270.1 outer membrane protein assembly factor BamB [Ectothiorhodospira variabilis]MCG5502338.1 outer membrane protein assembly factor BamB [Ectothiorhodospira variabilis]MCG5505896.1 outer membrane protein assembly factor BamB [Ectothiorhodospira variabilis]MCG5524543.1 outer membrane protein assembly factor BamB [Ectothi